MSRARAGRAKSLLSGDGRDSGRGWSGCLSISPEGVPPRVWRKKRRGRADRAVVVVGGWSTCPSCVCVRDELESPEPARYATRSRQIHSRQRPKTTATSDLYSYGPFTVTVAVAHDDLDASPVGRESRPREDASPAVSSW